MCRLKLNLMLLVLKLPEKLKVPLNIKTPNTWMRIGGNKAYISGHGLPVIIEALVEIDTDNEESMQ